MPPDFPETFVNLGWEAIEDHYATGQRVVKRWLRQAGEADLIMKRRAYLRKLYASHGLACIPGRKPGNKFGGLPEMRADDPGLAFMPVRRLRRACPTNFGVVRPRQDFPPPGSFEAPEYAQRCDQSAV